MTDYRVNQSRDSWQTQDGKWILLIRNVFYFEIIVCNIFLRFTCKYVITATTIVASIDPNESYSNARNANRKYFEQYT